LSEIADGADARVYDKAYPLSPGSLRRVLSLQAGDAQSF
jgi:hypothetical protein